MFHTSDNLQCLVKVSKIVFSVINFLYRLDAYLLLLKEYRNSQQEPCDNQKSAEEEQTEVMKTVQKVIRDIQRKYELAARTASTGDNAQQNQLMDITTEQSYGDADVVMSNEQELLPTSSAEFDNAMTSEQCNVPSTSQGHLPSTSEASPMAIANEPVHLRTGSEGLDVTTSKLSHVTTTNELHAPITNEVIHVPNTSDEANLPNTTEGGEMLTTAQSQDHTKVKKIRKRIERFREHNIPMSEFPHPKAATDEQVEELRVKYDFPPFPKLKDMGHGTIFTPEEEAEMRIFLSDCCVLGIPRTADQFKEDASVYYDVKTKDDPKRKKYVFGNKTI